MTLTFARAALDEVAEVVREYGGHQPGLGSRFQSELEGATAKILAHPLAWNLREPGYRRVNLSTFPYYVAYILRGEEVVVTAVAHVARRPGYWYERLKTN